MGEHIPHGYKKRFIQNELASLDYKLHNLYSF